METHPLADLPEADASRHISVVHFEAGLAPTPSTSEPVASADDWFVHELRAASRERLGELLIDGTAASRIDSASSGWSELDAEVERLAKALTQLRCACDITVVDYCRSRTRFTTGLNNKNLGAFMAKERPSWSKVRWLCVNGGIDGEVLSLLARAYNLQPLALEDTTTFQRVKVDAYREHLFVTSYVYDLVDRPRGRDRDRERQRRTRQQRQKRQGGGGGGNAANRGGGGGADLETGSGTERTGCCGGRRRRGSGRGRSRRVAWGTDDSDSGSYLSSSSGFSSPTTTAGDTSDDDGDGWGGGRAGAAAARGAGAGPSRGDAAAGGGGGAQVAGGARQLRRTYGRVWADDDDSAQVALEGWAGRMRAQQVALTKEWVDKVASGNLGTEPSRGGSRGGRSSAGGGAGSSTGGGGGREGSPARSSPAAGPSGRKRSQHAPSLQEPPGAGGLPPLPSASTGSKAAVAAVACHLGAKHRRRARLRIPLQAPFFSYQTSGRSLGRKKVMLEQASFFVCPGGVVISLFQHAGHQVAAPVLARLRGMQSLLVDSEDAGVLLQALLQASLDHSVPVFEAFASKVASVDAQLVDGKFHVAQSRRLHLLATDLSLMLRSFATLQPMLQSLLARAVLPPPDTEDEEEDEEEGTAADSASLEGGSAVRVPHHHAHGDAGGIAVAGGGGGRSGEAAAAGGGGVGGRLDGARVAAARAVGGVASAPPRGPPSVTSSHHQRQGGGYSAGGGARRFVAAGGPGGSLRGGGILLTELAGFYLADTHDQAVTGEQDLAALLEHTNRLNDLVFNSVSHSNESSNMTLAVLSMFFLPITFVSSVFGMNFEVFPEIKWTWGYPYFWGVCAMLILSCSLVLLRLRIVLMPRALRELPRRILCCLVCGGCRRCRRGGRGARRGV